MATEVVTSAYESLPLYVCPRPASAPSGFGGGASATPGCRTTLSLRHYNPDEWAGYVEGEDEPGKDWQRIHHIGCWVDDLEETEKKIEAAGGKYFQGRPTEKAPSTFYEMKFRDPHGVIVDCTHLGWGGSVKDVVPADEAEREKLAKRAEKKAASQAAE